MQIELVDNLLVNNGIKSPTLKALIPNEENYRVQLIQPLGDIVADQNGVRSANQELIQKQFSQFLFKANEGQFDLAITPEYSLPWTTLAEFVNLERGPIEGAIWVLGCESTTLNELAEFIGQMPPNVRIFHEPLEPQVGRFLDPLVYVFRSTLVDGANDPVLVLIIQFKTYPMGDDGHFEINGLQRGTRIYQFGGGVNQLRLASLICSDAFALTDDIAKAIHDRMLLIHIQLNPKPKHDLYRQYRARLLQFKGDQTELICLNWAGNVYESSGGSKKCWKNISGSAWYLRPSEFDTKESTIADNHRQGMYYMWIAPLRCHCVFFSCSPLVFAIKATKVVHLGVNAAVSRRRGPIVEASCVWIPESQEWQPLSPVKDGFSEFITDHCPVNNGLEELARRCPISAERVLALCEGYPAIGSDWYEITKLDSCVTDATEVVNRVTVCYGKEAEQFRKTRLGACHRTIRHIVASNPVPLSDFGDGFRFDWNKEFPFTNAMGSKGKRATVVALSEEHSGDATRVRDTLDLQLRRTTTDENQSLDARQRLVVWYRDSDGKDKILEPHRMVNYDNVSQESPVDITRSS